MCEFWTPYFSHALNISMYFFFGVMRFFFLAGDFCWRPFPVFLAMAASRRRGDPGDPVFRNGISLKRCYRWWKKSCTSWYRNFPMIYTVLYIPGGAGFLPSTVGGGFKPCFFLKFIFGEDDPNWLFFSSNTVETTKYVSFPYLSRSCSVASSSLAESVMQEIEDIAFHSF